MEYCIFYILPIIIILLILISYYRFAHLNKKLKEIFESMDIYLTKRWNSIPIILDYLKKDSKKDDEVYNKVTVMLETEYKQLSSEQKVKFNNELEAYLDIVIMNTFKASDLNENSLFVDVRTDHIEVEKDLDNIEKYYNNIVIKFNKRVRRFPSNIVAKLFSFKEKLTFNQSILNEENNAEEEN